MVTCPSRKMTFNYVKILIHFLAYIIYYDKLVIDYFDSSFLELNIFNLIKNTEHVFR